MQAISGYHRPSGLDEALALLNREDVASVVVGGGTTIAARSHQTATEVVDIQSCVDASIEPSPERVRYGAMVRLQDLIDHPATPPLLAETARREGPNTLRNAATVGGVVATAHWESELYAALLVHDTTIKIALPDHAAEVSLQELLGDPSLLERGIVTSVSAEVRGESASARSGRTPADTSIVAALGRVVASGLRLGLTGVAAHPVVVDSADLHSLDPPADFRGSSEYRMELAKTLTARVIDLLGGAA
jgi:CO/xanthine dehydrogenase FAD-binding subunit